MPLQAADLRIVPEDDLAGIEEAPDQVPDQGMDRFSIASV